MSVTTSTGFIDLLLQQNKATRGDRRRRAVSRRFVRDVWRIEVPIGKEVLWQVLDIPICCSHRRLEIRWIVGKRMHLRKPIDSPSLASSPRAIFRQALRSSAEIQFASHRTIVADMERRAIRSNVVIASLISV